MKKILSIVFSGFPNDPRPRREADAMVEAGMDVDMICLRREGQVKKELLYGVNVIRLSVKKDRSSKLRYLWQYSLFLFISFSLATRMHLKKRYDLIHVHNMPDFLVFSALIPKLFGAKILLDLHDPVPEVFMTKYGLKNDHIFIKILSYIEKKSIKFADLIITPNVAFKDLFISRGCDQNKIHIVMNSPMENVFSESLLQRQVDSSDKRNLFRIMFHGHISLHNGPAVALEALAIVKNVVPNIRFDIFGHGDNLGASKAYADKLALNEIVKFHGSVPQKAIAQHIVKSDLGLIPNRSTPFTDINFPTRIFEYLCLKKPVIVPRTKGILDYFEEGSICYFEPGNAEDLARAIIDMWESRDLREKYVERGYPIYFNNRWSLQKEYFIKLLQKIF